MLNQCWMRPAFQPTEALLLPALSPDDSFRPIEAFLTPQTQPAGKRGSMAGRSVLRAAGVRQAPMTRRYPKCR